MQTAIDGHIVQVNEKLCRMLGYDERELLGQSFHTLSHPDDVASTAERRKQLLAGQGVPTAVEKRYLHKNGGVIWVAVSPALIRDADGKPDYFVNIIECITERRKLQENLEHLARHDSLTRLPNRARFYDRLKHSLELARRRGWLTGVMFIDLDRFKAVNDTLGHGVGDQLLEQVAARLAQCVRADDTVGRLGGDEFAVIRSELAQEQNAGLVARKILDALGQPFQLEKHEVFVTASIGIATCEPGTYDADTMISNADAAMYDAKKLGRNNYQFYAATMSEEAMEKLLMEKELHYAIRRNEFLLNYQPKVNVKTGELTGFEALLRWHRTGGEQVSPVRFIPVLEECGMIEEVGEWVLRTACAQIGEWKRLGLDPVPIAVNLSPKQFQRYDIRDTVMRALVDHGIDPLLLDLEITESAAMNNAENAIAALQNLKALGVRIAIDDFGTGYSSLSYLKRFPIDYLKIDRSFVIDLPGSEDSGSIAQAVITMAQALRLKVIAEGVENLAQLDFLAANGCDEMQGYYASRPLSTEQATELLAGRRNLLARPHLVSAVSA
jgi:diguanylate cyclase (GGDEF)-like protein/PAS domain S-box-containing protein